MSNVVRIVERTQKPDEELNITLEVRVNKKRIENKMVFFGFLGSLKDDESLFPFVLHRDGQLDFGSLFDDEDRFGRTNIHERPIELGTFFSTRINIGDPSRLREAPARSPKSSILSSKTRPSTMQNGAEAHIVKVIGLRLYMHTESIPLASTEHL